MPRTDRINEYPICRYCHTRVRPGQVKHTGQKVHTDCVYSNNPEPDIIIDVGNFHAKVWSELMSDSRFSRLMSAIRRGEKYKIKHKEKS